MQISKKIPYGKQDISAEDVEFVTEVLKSEWLTQGPIVPKFEKAIANYVGSNFCSLANSATSALHISCLAIGVKEGDIVWTSPNTFVASANCAKLCGAKVDFVDIDEQTFNISVEALEDKLLKAKKKNCLPKVVIPVHMAGQSCDMKKIFELSKKYDFKIIEDASHALGGEYLNKKVGSCQYSDITVFSFHPIKMITTGEGGAVITNDPEISKKLKLFRTHGITSEASFFTPTPENELWNYQQTNLGLNYRMTDIQASLGLSQLKRIDQFVEKRQSIASYYNENFKNTNIKTPHIESYAKSSFHLYIMQWDFSKANKTNKFYFMELRKKGVMVNFHYIPVYLQPYYLKQGFNRGYCPNAEAYFQNSLSIPIYTTITEEELEIVSREIKLLLA
jgi:UDP-4-amino-4,6-dideoxy-N-acetyl-beta-L-altrosamine transaminase